MTTADEDTLGVTDAEADPSPPTGRGLRIALTAIIAVAVIVIAGAAGWLLRGGGSSSGLPAPSAVDIGFARDMATHHTQAVTMAGYVRDQTAAPQPGVPSRVTQSIYQLAFDIETDQEAQIGQMQGWLDSWGLTRQTTQPEMGWMNHPLPQGALMPGMATPAQLNQLETAHGRALDILFLQLMINHHLGGVSMAQYAVDNAALPYVRDLAQSIIDDQSAQITAMEQILRQDLGSSPLPPPTQ